MRHLSKAIALSMLCCTVAAQARPRPDQPLPPRLIAAERDGRLLLLLPETHAGLRDQYDHYFRAVIMPAFAASSALFSERSSPVQADTQLRYRPCADQQPDEAQVDAALNATLPELLPATYWGVQTPPAPVTGFSRFMRMQMVLEDAYFNSAGWYAPPWQPQPVPDLPSDLTTHYAARLMLDAPRRAVSVDTPDSSFKAYCSLTPAQRTALARAAMQQRLRQAGHAPPRDQLDRPVDAAAVERQDLQDKAAKMDAAYRQILKRIAQTLVRPDLDGNVGTGGPAGEYANDRNQHDVDRYLLGARNRVWVAQMPQMTAGQRLPFMVLGAAHFLDADADIGPGLLRLLRDDGYRLTLVRDPRQLAALLRKLPPTVAQVRPPTDHRWQHTTLDGLCTDIPKGTLCAWSGGNMLVQEIDNRSSRNMLTVCTTHATAWGPRQDCSALNVPGH